VGALERFAKVALCKGIHASTGASTRDMRAGNAAMLTALSDAGWRHKTRFDGSVLNIRIDLSQSGDSMQHESGTVS
jgi:hypothetical protein